VTGIADSVENLRAYGELLRTTNPVLEAGAADLGHLAHSLSDHESHLSLDLDHLAIEVDTLQKEAQSSGAAAVKACEELGHAAEEVNTTALAELEKGAAEVQSHWTAALHETSGALAAAFQELASWWGPLKAALESEQADFEKWTQTADEALHGIVQIVASVASDVAHQGTVLFWAAHDLEGASPFAKAYWFGVASHARTLTEETVPHFVDEVEHHSSELGAVHKQLVTATGEGSNHVRAQMDLTIQMAASAVDAQAGEVTHEVEAVVEALQNAQTEYERSTVQAADAEKESHELAELAGHVAEAEGRLRQVQAALKAIEP
jgi:hypothetical protein